MIKRFRVRPDGSWVVISGGVVALVVLLTLLVLSFCAGPPRPDGRGSPGIRVPLRISPVESPGPGSSSVVHPSLVAAGPPADGGWPGPALPGGGSDPGRTAVAPVPPAATTPPRTSTTTTPAAARNAYQILQAESFNARSGVTVETCAEGGTDITGIAGGDWVRYDNIDFGPTPPLDFLARVASGLSGGGSGLVQVRVGSPTSSPAGDFAIDNTGGWQSWRSVPGNVSGLTGRKTIYLTFTSAQPADFVSVNWFSFRH